MTTFQSMLILVGTFSRLMSGETYYQLDSVRHIFCICSYFSELTVVGALRNWLMDFNTRFRPASFSNLYFEFLDSINQMVHVIPKKFGPAIRPILFKIGSMMSFLMLYYKGDKTLTFLLIAKKETGKDRNLNTYAEDIKKMIVTKLHVPTCQYSIIYTDRVRTSRIINILHVILSLVGSDQDREKKIVAALNNLGISEGVDGETIYRIVDTIPTLDEEKTDNFKKLLTKENPEEVDFKCLAGEYQLRWSKKYKPDPGFC